MLEVDGPLQEMWTPRYMKLCSSDKCRRVRSNNIFFWNVIVIQRITKMVQILYFLWASFTRKNILVSVFMMKKISLASSATSYTLKCIYSSIYTCIYGWTDAQTQIIVYSYTAWANVLCCFPPQNSGNAKMKFALRFNEPTSDWSDGFDFWTCNFHF